MPFFSNRFEQHCKPIPVMKTGFSLCSISNSEKPVFITKEPCNENRFYAVWKTLFWPCTGLVRDCSEVKKTVSMFFFANFAVVKILLNVNFAYFVIDVIFGADR